MTLEEARLVLTVLSVFIARGRSRTRDKVSQMASGLAACCCVEGLRDGEVVPAAHPELSLSGSRAGATAMRRLGIDHREIEREWARSRTRATDACLPLAWVLEFVPARLWEAVLTLIKWGPAEAARRLEDAVIQLARQPIAIATRRRPAGATVSAGTIQTRVTGVHQLFTVLVELRSRAFASKNPGLPVALLEPWTVKPERPDVELCGAEWARVETAGPSFEHAREMLRRLDDDVKNAPRNSRYIRLRRRTVGALLVVHGPRVETLRGLDVSDYVREHNFGDGTTGPAVVYRPGKTRAADETHVLALPRELADWLEEWVTYTGRSVGESDSPLWPARKPKPGESFRRLNASAFERSINGHQAKDGTGSRPLLRRGDNPYHGFNPHSFRHTCYQLAKRAGAQAKLEELHRFAHVTPDDFARAVVGHDLVRGVGDFYRDLDQQHLARVAIEHAWTLLREEPMRVGPDPKAIKDAAEIMELHKAALADLEREFAAAERRQAALNAQQRELRGEALEAATLESNTLIFDLAHLQSDLAAETRRLEKARANLHGALTTDTRIEGRTDDGYAEELLQAQQQAALALATEEDTGTEELTVRELAAVLGVTTQTVNHWVREGFPRRSVPLWSPHAWTLNKRGIRSLALVRLNQDALSPVQQERLLLARLRHARDATRPGEAA